MARDRMIEFRLGGVLKILSDEPEAGVFVTLHYDGFTVTAKGNEMAYTLPDDHAVKVKVSYVDAKGHPAQVDGPVEWQSSNETVANVTADQADPMLALVVPGANLGQVQITVTADVDLGEGVSELITTMDVTVVGGAAVAGQIEPVGEPSPIQPEPRRS